MTCYHPLQAWQSKKCKPNGKKAIVFSCPARLDGYEMIHVPCGQCVGCRLERSKQWAIRCIHEAKFHSQNCFITLTYDDANVRWSAITGEQTLFKRDTQLFMKRLRKLIEPQKVRFFLCGEYGDTTNRPHYHAILFGFDFADKTPINITPAGNILYKSDTLSKLWPYGMCAIADVTFDSCAYVARYIMKKANGELAELKYEGIQPEFVNMSRRPGIGYDWFQAYKDDVYPYDEIVILDKDKTRICHPPKYYDRLYDLEQPEILAKIKEKRVEKAKTKEWEIFTPQRLEQKEKFKLAQTKSLKRSLD